MLHKCSHCTYLTLYTSHLKRHIESIHKPENPENENSAKITQDSAEITQDSTKITQNSAEITQDSANITINTQDTNGNKCITCNKCFTNKYNLQNHIKFNRCKKISNPLECNICNKSFNFPSGLSRHRKTCKDKQLTIINNDTTINNTNNTTNNINTINNNNITNNITNNIVVYNTENIEFDDSHITKRDLKRIFNGANKQAIEAMVQYGHKLLENIDNRCVEKKHVTNAYCKVHIGNGKWEQRPDVPVIDRFSQDVAISANDKLYDHPTIGETELRDEIAHLASHPENVHANAISLRREMRTLLLNRSNDVNNKNNS